MEMMQEMAMKDKRLRRGKDSDVIGGVKKRGRRGGKNRRKCRRGGGRRSANDGNRV